MFDMIHVLGGQKNPTQVWLRLKESHPEVATKCGYLQFPGAGQRETPVAKTKEDAYLALAPFRRRNRPYTLIESSRNKQMERGVMAKKRRLRIITEVAPLVARGATCDEVSEALNYCRAMAARDIQAVFEIWNEEARDHSERWRPLVVQRFELLFKEAFKAWESSKKSGRPNPRLLDTAGRNLETLTKLLGLQIDLTLNQTNIAIGASSSTAAALAPLDAQAYLEMVADGSLGQLNAVPAIAAT